MQMFIMIIIANKYTRSAQSTYMLSQIHCYILSVYFTLQEDAQNSIVSLSPFFPQNILIFIFLCSIFNRNTEKKNIFLEIDISILCVFRVKRPSQH